MSKEKLEVNLITQMKKKPQSVVAVAIDIYLVAEKNIKRSGGSGDLLEIADEVKNIIKGRGILTTLDVLKNYSEYHQTIFNWAPDITEENVGAASPFQGALLDSLEETAIEQINNRKEMILENIIIYGDDEMAVAFKEAYLNINDKKLDYMLKRDHLNTASLIVNQIDLAQNKNRIQTQISKFGDIELKESFIQLLSQVNDQKLDYSVRKEALNDITLITNHLNKIETIHLKITDLQKDLIIYHGQNKEDHLAQQAKGIKQDPVSLKLGLQTVKIELALEVFDDLQKIIKDPTIPHENKMTLFESKLTKNEKIISNAMPEKSKTIWQAFVEWFKKLLDKPLESNKTAEFKDSLKQLKNTNSDKPDIGEQSLPRLK